MTPFVRTARLVPLAGATLKMEVVEGPVEALSLTTECGCDDPPTYVPSVVVAGYEAPLSACESDTDLTAW